MLEKGFYEFKPFTTFDSLVKTFIYDSNYCAKNINEEKVKHNFSTRHWQQIVKDDKAILVYDIHGINDTDLKVTKISEDGVSYIKIEGTTNNAILDCEMSMNVRWAIPYRQFKKPTKKIENGLLYIFVEPVTEEEEVETI
jgi:hypothetical protein